MLEEEFSEGVIKEEMWLGTWFHSSLNEIKVEIASSFQDFSISAVLPKKYNKVKDVFFFETDYGSSSGAERY